MDTGHTQDPSSPRGLVDSCTFLVPESAAVRAHDERSFAGSSIDTAHFTHRRERRSASCYDPLGEGLDARKHTIEF
jgi:hypothetical protein